MYSTCLVCTALLKLIVWRTRMLAICPCKHMPFSATLRIIPTQTDSHVTLQLFNAPRERGLRRAAPCRKDAIEFSTLLVHLLLGPKATGAPPATGTPADTHATMSALLASDVLPLMLSHLSKLAFETRKDVVDIFAFTCKYQSAQGSSPGLEFLRQRPQLISNLVRGYEDPAVALNCGQMVRDAVGRDAQLATSVLNSNRTDLFFEYVQVRQLPQKVPRARCRAVLSGLNNDRPHL